MTSTLRVCLVPALMAVLGCSRGEAPGAVRPDPAARPASTAAAPQSAAPTATAGAQTSPAPSGDRPAEPSPARPTSGLPGPFARLGLPCDTPPPAPDPPIPAPQAQVQPAAPPQQAAPRRPTGFPQRPASERCGKGERIAVVTGFGFYRDLIPTNAPSRNDGMNAMRAHVDGERLFVSSACITCRLMTESTTVVALDLATDEELVEIQGHMKLPSAPVLRAPKEWRAALAAWAKKPAT